MDRELGGSSLEPQFADQCPASPSVIRVLRRVGQRVLSQNCPSDSSTLFYNPEFYKLVIVNPDQESEVQRNPRHSTPEGSPPPSPDVGVSTINIVEASVTDIEDNSEHLTEEVFKALEEMAPPADPLAEVETLILEDDIDGFKREYVKIWKTVKIIFNTLDEYTPNDIQSVFDSKEYEDYMKAMITTSSDLYNQMDDVLLELQRTERGYADDVPKNSEKLKNLKKYVREKVKSHLNLLRARMGFLKRQTGAGGDGAAAAGGGGAEFQIFEDRPNRAGNNQDAVLARSRIRCRAITDDSAALSGELEEIDVYMWSDASDLDVNKAMRKIKTWKEDLTKIVKAMRDVEEMLTVANVPNMPEEATEALKTVEDLQELFKNTKKEVENEDIVRGLHSLDISAAAKVNLPTFEGRDDEDWSIFKEKLLKALIANKVKTADKCEKLRESLRGYARKLVPATQNDFDAALRALEKAFGDSTRVVNAKINALNKLGPVPKNNDKKGGKTVVEWYLNLETLLTSLLDLGKTDDEDIRSSVFALKIVQTVANLFPELYGIQILECRGTGESRMRNVINKISDFRGKAQQWLNAQPQAAASSQPEASKTSGNGGGGGGSGGNRNNYSRGGRKLNLITFKPPVRLPECRICKILEESGDTREIYDNHHSNFPTGCPRFIMMSVEQRRDICIKAKFCLRCLDPKYKYVRADIRHKCMDFTRKSRYSCPKGDCKSHLWTCTRHRDENTSEFEKFKDEIKNKLGLQFCYFIGMTPVYQSDDENSASDYYSTSSRSPVTTGAVRERRSQLEDPFVPPTASTSTDTVTSTSPTAATTSSSSPNQSLNTSSQSRLTSSEAFEILKRKMKVKKIRAEFRPIEAGSPQYMLGYSRGKTRPLVTLYDTGCQTILFKEGVPDKELGPAVIKMKGPMYVNGVGDTSVRVNSEYMCSIPLIDGTRAILEGVSVDRISSPLPYTKLGTAENAIKSSDPGNAELQSLRCNEEVGGELDILIGIYYSALFPIPVHTLPSGLVIYKVVISSHNPRYNAVIGGPHESFAGLASHFGGFGSAFFSQLQAQLDDFRELGPPSISKALMSAEDYEFAEKFKENEELFETEDHDQDCSVEVETLEESELEKSVLNIITSSLNISEAVQKVSCQDCGESLDTALMSINDDEDVQQLRMVQRAQEEGLSVEYRCPKCRNCNDCRNSHETERISLREEAEDLMIRDSVKLDWQNKKIISHLPMRGKEEEFLSNNRENAVNILKQQCAKYFADEDTKEIILGAFNKLLKNKQMLLWDDLPQEDKDLILSKEINHYIVWRVVFKASLSTPARIVFDASARTKPIENGTRGGRCLNDLVVKGKVTTLNLTKMVLRFCIGPEAVQGDLRQFYASIKLIKDNWNLQRVLFKPDLDPDSPMVEAVISTLIWGVKCVSAQSEAAVDKIALSVMNTNPRLAELLRDSRFVDDIADSECKKEEIVKLIEDANQIFESVGLSCKGWSVSGEDPPEDVCEDGGTVSIGGMKWYTKPDCLEVPIPMLHFSKKSRGRLVIGTEVFDGEMLEDLEKFVPANLTRRMVVSKKASLFDVLGKLTPISARLSLDLRKVMKETNDWEDSVSPPLRQRWVENFFLLEQLRGIKFARARMPEDAVSPEMDLIIAGDTAKEFVKICGVWGRFKLKNGNFSNQHLIGRSLLGDEDSSIPKEELESLTMCSNLGWIVRQMLSKWVRDYIVISDSTISLCWVISEKKKLSLFHRNRVVQTRRGTETERLYHCRSEYNPCDLGTRTGKVSVTDVGPHSTWELGLPWMTHSVEDAVNVGILTPAANLIMTEEENEEYKQGFVFEKSQDILTRGHVTFYTKRDEKVTERLKFSNYIISPLKFKFDKTVRIISIVFKFIKSFKCIKGKVKMFGAEAKFQMFPVKSEEAAALTGVSVGVRDPGLKFRGKHHIVLTDSDMSKALEYLYRKATAEVKEFNKSEFVKKIAVEKDDILYSKSRILDGQRLQVAAGLENMEFLSSFKPFRNGLNLVCPVIDRFSPLSLSIAEHVHSQVSGHRGYESCYRASLDFVFIVMGLSLFREIGEDCIKCKKLRTKYIDVSIGPLPNEAFVISPPFYICQVDIMGPLHVYVPGHSMALRNRKILEGKCYALVSVCMITKCVNIQVIESKSADGVIDGINRLSCEAGVPKFVIVDQDTGITKALTDCDVSLKDLQLHLYQERGIQFRTVPVSGHNMTGLVERKIKSVQECMERMEIDKMRLHATGYQTLFKLIENDLNNLPIGFGYGRKDDNSPILKIIYPNLLRLGRNNNRSLDTVIKLPKTPGDMMHKIENAYQTFYELWNTVLIPKMMKPSKWFDDTEVKIVPGDLVYFKKVENELSSKWTVGKVTDVVYSKDGKARTATVVYQNASEDFSNKRTTERSVRSLVKLFNIDDKMWTSELSNIDKIIADIAEENNENETNEENYQSANSTLIEPHLIGSKLKMKMLVKADMKPCKTCCCYAHCKLVEVHGRSGNKMKVSKLLTTVEETEFTDITDKSWDEPEEYEDYLDFNIPASAVSDITSLVTAVNINLEEEPVSDQLWSTED